MDPSEERQGVTDGELVVQRQLLCKTKAITFQMVACVDVLSQMSQHPVNSGTNKQNLKAQLRTNTTTIFQLIY